PFQLSLVTPHPGLPSGQQRQLDQGGGRRAAASLDEHLADLRQARLAATCRGSAALARERGMSAPSDLASDLGVRVEQYLDQRRHLGFELCSAENILPTSPRFVTDVRHAGPLTVEVMAQWARQVQPRYL